MKKLTKNKDKSISLRANKLIEKWRKIVDNKKSQKPKSEIKPQMETSKLEESFSNEAPNSIIEKSNNFDIIHKKNLDKLNSSSYTSLRNSVRKTLYEALLNKERLDGNIK